MDSESTRTEVELLSDFQLGQRGPRVEVLSVSSPHDESTGIEVTHCTELSNKMKLLQDVVRKVKPRLRRSSGKHDFGSIRLKPPKHRALRGCKCRERIRGGMWIYDVSTKKKRSIGEYPKKRIYYLTGGSWQDIPGLPHWRFAAELARRVPNVTVSVISQHLAPMSPALFAMDQLGKLYRQLMEQSHEKGERVIWLGDGSGANVALGQVIWSLARGGEAQPVAVMAICPPTDLRHTDERMLEIVEQDPIHTVKAIQHAARNWAPVVEGNIPYKMDPFPGSNPIVRPWAVEDPRVSPIFAPLHLFATFNVKVHGVTAGYDILSPEALTFREKLREQGVSGQWLHWDKQMHCFPLADGWGVRESKEAMDWIIGVLTRA